MPRTGRPPKTVEQKRRIGNPGKRPLPTNITVMPPVAISVLVDGPLITNLVESGAAPWIGATDMPTVRLAQRLSDDMDRLRLALDEEFSEPVFRAYRDTIKGYIACLSLLGLSPTDRTRLGVAEVKARSQLDELMDRRGRRDTTRQSPPEPLPLEMAKTS